jgi:hypothetical protein
MRAAHDRAEDTERRRREEARAQRSARARARALAEGLPWHTKPPDASADDAGDSGPSAAKGEG